MPVKHCYMCAEDPQAKRLYGRQGLAEGKDCPICYRPTCRYHLTIVRWRWRADGRTDSTLICKGCKNSYAHRNWDVANRDWIT